MLRWNDQVQRQAVIFGAIFGTILGFILALFAIHIPQLLFLVQLFLLIYLYYKSNPGVSLPERPAVNLVAPRITILSLCPPDSLDLFQQCLKRHYDTVSIHSLNGGSLQYIFPPDEPLNPCILVASSRPPQPNDTLGLLIQQLQSQPYSKLNNDIAVFLTDTSLTIPSQTMWNEYKRKYGSNAHVILDPIDRISIWASLDDQISAFLSQTSRRLASR